MKNNSDLFYTCSLIEYIGRKQKQRRETVVKLLGQETIRRIYRYADVFHCEPIAKTADDFISAIYLLEPMTTLKKQNMKFRTIGQLEKYTRG